MKEYKIEYFPGDERIYDNTQNEYFFITQNEVIEEQNKDYEKLERKINNKFEEIKILENKSTSLIDKLEIEESKLTEIRVKAEIEENKNLSQIIAKSKKIINEISTEIEKNKESIKTKTIVINKFQEELNRLSKTIKSKAIKEVYERLINYNEELEKDVKKLMKTVSKAFTEYETFQNYQRKNLGCDYARRSYFSEIKALNNLLNGIIMATSKSNNYYE